jgi:hypothetical protein
MLSQQNRILEQKVFVKGYQRFEIRNDGDLAVLFKRFSIRREFRIPLWQILPKPERHKSVNAGSLVGAIVFGVAALWIIWGMISCFRSPTDKDITFVLIFPLIFVGTFFVISFYRYMIRSVDATIFYFRGGGQIHIWTGKPNKAHFSSFCEMLSEKAEDAWNYRPVEPESQSIAGEIAALKRLNSTGVLTDAEFERAKAKLLEQTQEKRIGFA